MTNRALRHEFQSTSDATVYDLQVQGKLPLALNGRYLRTGAREAIEVNAHGVVGDGVVHELKLHAGTAACYKRRLIDHFSHASTLERASPMRGIGNEALFRLGEQLFVVGDLAMPYALDAELNVTAAPTWASSLAQGIVAHPKRAEKEAALHCVAYDVTVPRARYFTVDTRHRITRAASIDFKRAHVAHDFVFTHAHIGVLAQPLIHDPELGFDSRFPYRWSPANGSALALLNRESDEAPRWFDLPSKLITHIVNAFEERGHLILDLTTQDSLDATPSLERWWIDLQRGRVIADVVAHGQTMPRINERCTTHSHQFVYSIHAPTAVGGHGSLHKWDMRNDQNHHLNLDAGWFADEFVFAARSAGREDDGWLMGFVQNRDRRQWWLVDAKDIAAGPIARVEIPFAADSGRHGIWVAEPLPLAAGTRSGR